MTDKLAPQFNDFSASAQPDLMTDAEYAAAYQAMAQGFLEGRQEKEKPSLLYVTGLPGAGKSSTVRNALHDPAFAHHLVINFDDLRVYHPRYREHVKNDPVNAAARIDKAVEGLIGWLCEEAARRKADVILDDAAMGAEMTGIVLAPFEKAGYDIDAVVMAVPDRIARQSVHLRFEKDYAAAKSGAAALPRWVNSEEQANAPAALFETVETLANDRHIGSLMLINREGRVLYPAPAHAVLQDAGRIVKAELVRDLTPREIAAYQDNAETIARLMNARTGAQKPAHGNRPSGRAPS